MRQVLNKYKLFLWTIKIPILLYEYPYNVRRMLKSEEEGNLHHHLTLFYHSYQKRGGYL